MSETSPQPWLAHHTALAEFFYSVKTWILEWSPVLSVGLAIVGIGFTLLGGWLLQRPSFTASAQETTVLETSEPTLGVSLSSTPLSSQAAIRVHIAGAVRKPGVYEVPQASVLQDLVIKAGGLSSQVWQDYLDSAINLAAPLHPNQKIWIPTLQQQELLQNSLDVPVTPSTLLSSVETASPTALISINTGSLAELDTLAGIGQKRAEDIVANRPYVTIDELVSKAKLPQSLVDSVRSQLIL